MEFVNGFRKGKIPIIHIGDVVEILTDDDDDLYDWSLQHEGEMIVEGVEYESNLIWLQNCDYAISIDNVLSVSKKILERYEKSNGIVEVLKRKLSIRDGNEGLEIVLARLTKKSGMIEYVTWLRWNNSEESMDAFSSGHYFVDYENAEHDWIKRD